MDGVSLLFSYNRQGNWGHTQRNGAITANARTIRDCFNPYFGFQSVKMNRQWISLYSPLPISADIVIRATFLHL